MSGFLSKEAEALAPYTPGEQPKEQWYVKLNTNESPYPPSPMVLAALTDVEVIRLNLYPDPACTVLADALAERYGLSRENIIVGNGSDEILAFAFRAFCGQGKPVAYADVTYGFYRSQSALFGLTAKEIPLLEDFSLRVDDYMDFPGTVVIANPNAPTGMAVSPDEIRWLLKANPDRVVIVDEAYVDFGAESCVPMIHDYENLLVVQTMSKSRSLAGGRVGYAMGSPALISALNRVKYSFNPYNVNRLSLLAATASVRDEEHFRTCVSSVQGTRGWTETKLRELGFLILPSKANFLFVRHEEISGEDLYRRLKRNGYLVRWFDAPRLRDFVRITIGSPKDMAGLTLEIGRLLGV